MKERARGARIVGGSEQCPEFVDFWLAVMQKLQTCAEKVWM